MKCSEYLPEKGNGANYINVAQATYIKLLLRKKFLEAPA